MANDLVKVAQASQQAEAEFIQNLLRDAGVPSMLRRAGGFDVADMLAAGPRDVLVPAAMEQIARDVLLQND
jgi:butyrate kinase